MELSVPGGLFRAVTETMFCSRPRLPETHWPCRHLQSGVVCCVYVCEMFTSPSREAIHSTLIAAAAVVSCRE